MRFTLLLILGVLLNPVKILAQTAQYQIHQSYVKYSGQVVPTIDYKVRIELKEQSHDTLIITWTSEDLQVYLPGLKGHVLQSLQNIKIDIVFTKNLNDIIILQANEIEELINENLSAAYPCCFNMPSSNGSCLEQYLRHLFASELLFLYPSVFDMRRVSQLELPTACGNIWLTSEVFLDSEKSIGQEKIARYELDIDEVDMHALYDCLLDVEIANGDRCLEAKIESTHDEYLLLDYDKRKDTPKNRFVESKLKYERNQVERLLRFYKQNIELVKQSNERKSVSLQWTESDGLLPKSVRIERPIFTICFQPQNENQWAINRIEFTRLNYSK